MVSKYFSDNTMEERQEIFQEYFDRDLERYFSSRISCCEKCFDEFCGEWPGTASRDDDFLTSGIEISYFLEQSRIQEAFHPDEIALFSKELRCPNCDAVLDGVFYIFEHKFLVYDFNLGSISDLARTSPFLLLSHPFAAKVFEVIKRKVDTAETLPGKAIWYRGRMARDVPDPATLAHFAPPPAAKVYEGRYNHAGHPMLYLAGSVDTVKGEMRASEGIAVAEIELDLPCRVLDLMIADYIDGDDDEVIQCLARSALCMAPRKSDGWDRPEYVFTRFVGDCARHAGFGAIRYGSVQDSQGVNVVVLKPPADFSACARLISVQVI
ncbi:RES family NAD+ phosphorylase [Xanthobacter aminoxidans]|uniref:RES family NAD+ phosphorylase n=1 Tax=Xanthobacter aminoxidans TaxID=186280 RepID=UPI00202318AC|nr:RES family NAD+ phosphorylase [Xanthobacter aminoxidans]MCL8384303.1 RES family NAD+ phosphorylase [Xanthobacter aminoxidans]